MIVSRGQNIPKILSFVGATIDAAKVNSEEAVNKFSILECKFVFEIPSARIFEALKLVHFIKQKYFCFFHKTLQLFSQK